MTTDLAEIVRADRMGMIRRLSSGITYRVEPLAQACALQCGFGALRWDKDSYLRAAEIHSMRQALTRASKSGLGFFTTADEWRRA